MHTELLALLDRYAACYPAEQAVAAQIRGLVQSHSDCLLRTCRPGHVTGSAWVLSPDRTRCLLVHHARLGRWLQPGGHADGESALEQVALREVREETGLNSLELPLHDGQLVPLDLDVHLIPARHAADGSVVEGAHEHHDVRFLVLATADEPLTVSDESHDVRWFTAEEVRAHTDEESVLRMLRKAGREWRMPKDE